MTAYMPRPQAAMVPIYARDRNGRTLDQIVHGDIRHLEKRNLNSDIFCEVHGDIRHLEKRVQSFGQPEPVHGDIRHLES